MFRLVKRIGLIGGMSWESTRSYYTALNEITAQRRGPWSQPPVIIDSLDFKEIVELQNSDDWSGTGRILADSARRLERAGADVLAITANTMHLNYEQVASAVSVPVLDIRDAVGNELRASGSDSISLLGTRFVMEKDFFAAHLEGQGFRVVRPVGLQIEQLQSMIYDELTQGVVSEDSRHRFVSIAEDCRDRGGKVVGLCCTEFGMFFADRVAPWPVIDSTLAHVKALLDY